MARIETQDQGSTALGIAGKELAPGEKLVWADRPSAAGLAKRDGPKFLMGIPFTAFALFWTWGASSATGHAPMGIGIFFPLWGLMFIAIGLWILSSPLRAAMKASLTVYAITSDRLLIIEGARSHRITSFTPADVQQIERTERGDGSGDVVFRKENPTSSRGFSFNGNWTATRIGFFGVRDVRRVEASVRQLAQQANRAG
jgi:hypothetical protein